MIRLAFLVLGSALLAYLSLRLGLDRIASMLRGIGWDVLPVVVIYTGHQAARAAALLMCLPRGRPSWYRDLVWIRLSGEAVQLLTFTGPFLAEPAKARLLRARGLTTREAFAGTLTEYLVYTLTSAALASVGLIYLLRNFDLTDGMSIAARSIVYGMIAFLLVSIVAIVFRVYLIGAIVQGLASLPVVRRHLRPDMDWINRLEDLLLVVLRDSPARLVGIVAIELLAQALLVVELSWILGALGVAVPSVYPFLIEAATKFTGMAFFFIPAQVGAAEGVTALVFEALGLAAAAGFTVAFIRRLRSLFVAGAGLLSIWWLTRRHPPA